MRGAAIALALTGLLTAAPGRAEPAVAVASATRLAVDGAATHLVVDLDRPVAAGAFALADPDRIVVDLPGAVFHAPPPSGGGGVVRAYRFGLITKARSRLVIDLARPATAAVRTVAAADGRPSRLMVDLTPTTRDGFLRAIAAQPRPAPLPTPATAGRGVGRDDRPLIVLDPGHGGIDPGTHGPLGQEEKDIVLDFAKALRDQLAASGRYRVLMTRDDDSYVALDARVDFAREHQAKLLVSIHADSLSWPYQADAAVHGATIYTLSDRASDAQAARLAETENRSDAIAGVDLSAEPDAVAGILIDLARRETHMFSARFARDVENAADGSIPLNKNPVRSAGFVVLKAPDVPSVLVELGYMSSQADLKRLTAPAWRQRAAAAMVRAVDSFFGMRLSAAERN